MLRKILYPVAILACLVGSLAWPIAATAADPPDETERRWIDVDLTTYQATAYVGEAPVYSAPITAGKPGFETPTGSYRVIRRVASETMDSATLGIPRSSAEGYYLRDVRYTQYITGTGLALHANYWMPDWVFGKAHTSHGCIGMRLADAAYFWNFATHGTPVVIRKSETVAVVPVVGQPLAAARESLAAWGLRVSVEERLSEQAPEGVVVAQEPAAGTRVLPGGTVTLAVSKAPPRPTPAPVRPPEGDFAWVPEVVGLPEAEARQRIDQAGLTSTYTNYQVESDVPESARDFFRETPPGAVLSSSPQAGERVPRGTAVGLAVRKQ